MTTETNKNIDSTTSTSNETTYDDLELDLTGIYDDINSGLIAQDVVSSSEPQPSSITTNLNLEVSNALDIFKRSESEENVCSGKTGMSLDACRLKTKVNKAIGTLEQKTGIYTSESRAEASKEDSTFIIKGNEIKWNYGF